MLVNNQVGLVVADVGTLLADGTGDGMRHQARQASRSWSRSSVKSSVPWPEVVKMAARSVGFNSDSMWRCGGGAYAYQVGGPP